MDTIQQLEAHIEELKLQMKVCSETLPYNHDLRRSLGAALMQSQQKLDDLLYEQSEADAERIEHISYIMLCNRNY